MNDIQRIKLLLDYNTFLKNCVSTQPNKETIKEYMKGSEWHEPIKTHSVSKCTEVNLVVFEEYTRCYRVTDGELEKLIEDGDIEEGDTVCKAIVIKDY